MATAGKGGDKILYLTGLWEMYRRWAGVPWIMKAGKALNERKVEIRVQYKPPASGIHPNLNEMRNELVVRAPEPSCEVPSALSASIDARKG